LPANAFHFAVGMNLGESAGRTGRRERWGLSEGPAPGDANPRQLADRMNGHTGLHVIDGSTFTDDLRVNPSHPDRI
jgi:hypothetical protein